VVFSAGGDDGRRLSEHLAQFAHVVAAASDCEQSQFIRQNENGILATVVTGNFLHEHHDPAPHRGIINSHERSDQP
jgi:hypothetical protein